MKIKVRKLTETAKLPTRGSSEAAGYDLYADLRENESIAPHEPKMIGIGLSMELPSGYFGAVFARSGLASRESLRPANCVGVIDSDYRGPFMVPLHNDGETTRTVEPGERIAQLIIMPYLPVTFEATEEELSSTRRGESGFGSTGK